MDVWGRVAELNTARAGLGEKPWFYTGDCNIQHGGIAILVEPHGTYADTVEACNLGSAIGQDGVALLEQYSVPLRGDRDGRRRMRSALSCVGMTVRSLTEYARGRDRWTQVAYALHVYGYRDSVSSTVVAFEPDALDRGELADGGGFDIEQRVEGPEGLLDAFMDLLD
jgi:hypothetical protein